MTRLPPMSHSFASSGFVTRLPLLLRLWLHACTSTDHHHFAQGSDSCCPVYTSRDHLTLQLAAALLVQVFIPERPWHARPPRRNLFDGASGCACCPLICGCLTGMAAAAQATLTNRRLLCPCQTLQQLSTRMHSSQKLQCEA